MYGPSHGEQCADLSLTSEIRNSSLDSTSTAVLIKHLHLQNESRFCSIITASDGTTTASIEKVLNAGILVTVL